MNRAPMLTRSRNAPYGAFAASIIFPPFGPSARLCAHEDALFRPCRQGGGAYVLPRIENQLRAAKQRERAPLLAVGHGRVPDLGGAPQVHGARLAVELAFLRGSEEIRLELNGREILRVRGHVRNAAVACQRVGKAHDRTGVEISVRREKRLAELELSSHQTL